jgi:hypothetical protein
MVDRSARGTTPKDARIDGRRDREYVERYDIAELE